MPESFNLSRLAEPLPAESVEWRIGQCGKKNDGTYWAKALAYLTNRSIMHLLDDVVGPANWTNEYREWSGGGKHGVLCGLSIRCDGEWITKWDGAENTDIESIKGGLSDAMKRAAVQWGIGRYLYKLEATFVECSTQRQSGWNYARDKAGEFYWKTPDLPAWALPAGSGGRGSRRAGNATESTGPVLSRKSAAVDMPQPTAAKVVEVLAAATDFDRLEDAYAAACKPAYRWTKGDRDRIDACYLETVQKVNDWRIKDNIFHDVAGRPVAVLQRSGNGRYVIVFGDAASAA